MGRLVLLIVIFIITLTQASLDITKLNTLKGWGAQIVTSSVPDVRQLSLTPDESIIFAGSSGSNVYAVPISYQNNTLIQNGPVKIILHNQIYPHGVAFDPTTNDLYISSNYTTVSKFTNILSNLDNLPPLIVIFNQFPNSSLYGAKDLCFNHNYTRIYTSQGANCSACLLHYSANPPSFYSTIVSFKKDGSDLLTHAFGVRNAVGFEFNPYSINELWFTDPGRQGLGDDVPPSELNKLPNADQAITPTPHYGFPFCYGKDYADPNFFTGNCSASYIGAEYEIHSHVAPLGLIFYNGSALPPGTVLIAERGSTNSTVFVGYRVVMFNVNDPNSVETVFVDGWLESENPPVIMGRPVDVVQMKDGSVLVSDEIAGAIIRFYPTFNAQTPEPNPIPSPSTVPTSTPSHTSPVPGTSPSAPSGGSILQVWITLLVFVMMVIFVMSV